MQALLVNCNLQIVDDLGLKDPRIAISRCNQCTKEWSWQIDLKMPLAGHRDSSATLVLGGMVTQLTLTQEIGSSTLSGPTMICKKCGIDKEESEFVFKNKKLNIRHCVCKECQRNYKRAYYYRNKESHFERNKKTLEKIDSYILSYKLEHPCIMCGETAPECLDFHHVKEKTDEVGDLRKNGSFLKVVEEIKKCVVLCANCHRKVHAGALKIEG